jgi:hypothetical protein
MDWTLKKRALLKVRKSKPKPKTLNLKLPGVKPTKAKPKQQWKINQQSKVISSGCCM